MEYPTAVLFGPPYAGKTSLGRRADANFVHIHYAATGDMVRSAIGQDDDLGRRVKEYLTRGELVPDKFILPMVREYVAALIEEGIFCPGEQFLLLDGCPRNVSQARNLDGLLEVFEVFDCSGVGEAELLNRFSNRVSEAAASGKPRRSDDTIDAAHHRIRSYFEITAPVLEFYHNRGVPVTRVAMNLGKQKTYDKFEHHLNNRTLPLFHNNL